MARETKVGLLVGMGFIVCFAIILSHRGADAADPFDVAPANADEIVAVPPASEVSQAEHRARDVGRDRARTQEAERPTPTRRQREERRFDDEPFAQVADGSRRSTGSGRSDRFENRGEALPGGVDDSTRSAIDLSPRTLAYNDSADSGSEAFVPHLPAGADGMDQSNGRRAEEAISNALNGLMNTLASTTPAPAPSTDDFVPVEPENRHDEYIELDPVPQRPSEQPIARESGPVLLATYRIKKGDSLTSISQEYYGKATPSLISMIYEANRDRLESPDKVVIGEELRIPRLEANENSTSTPEVARRDEVAPMRTTPQERTPQPSVRQDVTASRPQAGRGKTYEVREGDSLARIAENEYGSSAPRYIEAICKANPETLSDPNRVLAGVEIVLPVLENRPETAAEPVVREREAVGGGRPANTVRPTPGLRRSTPGIQLQEDDARDWEWYQVQKGDRFSTIAEDLLGSSERWKELADLNKDVFPDPNRIRHGVKIKVPKERAAGA